MDPIMELALLQRRFPSVSVNDFGNLIKDAFCARCIDSHTYEGRLFVTEKAVFFASSYSDAKVYDVHIASGAIESVTAFHRSIIPSLEFTLTSGKEEFTNFHNLSSVVKSLCSLLPGKVHEVKPHVAPIKLNRMTSVPARPHPLSPPVSTLVDPLNMKKVPPCPFFLKGGFCPRQPFCQFEHGTPSLPPNLHQSSVQHSASTNLEHVVNMKSFHLKPSGVLRSPTKKLHVAESSEGEGSSLCDKDLTHSQMERLDFGKISLKKKDEEMVEYVRSQSLPDRELKYGDDESHSQTNMGNGNKTEVPDRSSSDSALGKQKKVNSSLSETAELCTGEKRSKTNAEEKVTKGEQDKHGLITGATPSNEGDGSILVSPELVVPKKFDFLSTSDETCEVVAVQETNSELNDRGQSEEGVFVFTGSSSGPSSPDYVKSKKKTTSVSFNLSAQEIGGEGEAISKDEMSALLAQQLELGGSDSDSLQGDLDLEYQRRLLASFSKSGEPHGPFRGGDAESASFSGAQVTSKCQPPPPPPPLPRLPRLPRVFPSVEEDKQDKSDKVTSSSSSSSSASEGSAILKPSSITSPPVSGQKRQPCVYFLSGYCRNGPICPDFHGMDPDMEDFDYDDLGLLPIPPKLSVHSADSIGRKDINSGDKIILSPQVLMSCEQQELSYPISFKLEHPSSGETVYAGVLEFTSPSPEAAYLPQWMMDHLGASEGEEMNFEHVELPKGKFVRLQPVSSAWLGIPYDTRMAMMEFQLRNFQTLTEGAKVTLTYELNRYTLKVLECKPSKGISIVDADLTTDIVEPADFNRYHSIVEGQAVNIGLEEPVTCQVEATYYRHFVLLSLPGQPLPSRLHVEVKSLHGDPDLFLSQSCTAPSQRRYTWCCQDVGDLEIELSTDEKGFDINKPLYAGVVGLCEDAQFTITFHRCDTLAAAKARHLSPGYFQSGKTLRASPSDTAATTTTTGLTTSPPLTNHTTLLEEATPSVTPPPPGHERCSYCGSVMPSLRLLMHERHCAQSTFKCPLCKTCMPKAAEKKHHYITHELLVCECGKELTQLALHRHQEIDCSKRSVKCQFKWCNLSFPMDQLREHEDLCGRKKMPCPICKEEVPMLEVEGHLEAFHSVDTSKIDWNKSLASQVTNASDTSEQQMNFSCACGKYFQFQDDLQVHQLTECSLRRVVEDNPLAAADLRTDDIVG